MRKKTFTILLAFAMVMTLGVHAFAAEDEAIMPVPVVAEITSNGTGVMPLSGTFSISFNSLGANYYTAYSGTFSLSGTEKLGYSASWSPTAQNIKIGVRNTSTGTIYDTTISGGDASGTFRLSSKSVPAGEYQVVVINPYGASYSVSGNINFEWK